MINFFGKNLAIKIYRIFFKLKIKRLKNKVKESHPDLDDYIIELFLKNYGSSAAVSLLNRLERLCKILKPKLIVEFGSGISTALLAKVNQGSDCKIFTFEEDLEYLK